MPIAHSSAIETKKKTNARTSSSETPLSLPFWDDFSKGAADTLWEEYTSVAITQGLAVNPPSIFAATFDGISATGKPYDLNDVLAKGYADVLTSRPIDLATLVNQNDSVYLSFFYQVTGHGEAPDLDDNFSLSLKDKNGTWVKVFDVANSAALDPATFYYAHVKVAFDYFHENFQFRFQNFARLSGPYDTWHLDYIFLNARRYNTSFYFPDRSVSHPPTTIFQDYTSIPVKHFKDTAKYVVANAASRFFNFSVLNQPSNYSTYAQVTTFAADTTEKTIPIDSAIVIQINSRSFELADELSPVPPDSLNLLADSIHIRYFLYMISGDGREENRARFLDSLRFMRNDTTFSDFSLGKHYAYDDGVAEYGAGLNSAGSQVAYRFNMLTKQRDSLVAIDIYFPEFGDTKSRTLLLKIWGAGNDGPGPELHSETISVTRTVQNTFTRYRLQEPIGVKGNFYVGWQQNVAASIPAGLDKNNNTGQFMYFNTTGSWQQNQTLEGCLMVRPFFGKGKAGEVLGVEENSFKPYPNPNHGRFFIPANASQIHIFDTLGREIPFSASGYGDHQSVELTSCESGLYIVTWVENGRYRHSKIRVQKTQP